MAKIDDKKLFDRIKWSPYYDYRKGEKKRHEAQIDILNSKARDITICAGTRGGKSQLCAYVAFKRLLADNQKIWVISLSYDLAKKIFNYVIDFAGKYDRRLLKGIKDKPFPRFEVKEWNSWIECKSTDVPHGLMGEELDLAIIDEGARMKPEIWERYISARLASRKGKSFIISTPYGEGNWFHRRYLQTKHSEDGDSFHFTSKDNPYFPLDEWDLRKETLPQDIFQQEYMASFLAQAAKVFRGVEDIIRDCSSEPKREHLYYMGVDLGKQRDFTVLTVIDSSVYPHQVVFVDRFNRIEYPFQKKRILSTAQKYNNARMCVDANNIGEVMVEEFKRESHSVVEGFKFTGGKGGSKKELIEKLSIFIEQKKIHILDYDVLIDELNSFGYIMTDLGNIRYSAPEGLHDDCVISLALACWKLRGKKMGLEQEPIVFDYPQY